MRQLDRHRHICRQMDTMCTLMMCVSVYVGVLLCFSMACGRMGPTSTGTSLTVYKKSQAWVSLNNLLILWISTQSCDNDTSWVDLTGQTAGGRGGKPICSCKDWGETLITNTPKETKGQRDMYSSVSTSLPPPPPISLLGCLVSQCVDMDVWICYRHDGLAVLPS